MKRLLLFLFIILSSSAFSQKPKQIIKETFHLNSQAKDFWLGGKSRVYYVVTIPENSKEFYYSISTGVGSNIDLNLFSQLMLLYDPTGFNSSVISNLKVPTGSNVCNVYLTSENDAKKFLKFNRFSYQKEYSRERLKNGIVHFPISGGGKVVFCFENPSSLIGLYISFELVAMLD